MGERVKRPLTKEYKTFKRVKKDFYFPVSSVIL